MNHSPAHLTQARAVFAALWPSVSRYAGKVASVLARRNRLDRDDLFAAASLAVWRGCIGGKFPDTDDPRLACVVAKHGILTELARQRRHRRVAAVDPADLAAVSGVDATAAADAELDFRLLLERARPADRQLLERHFRDGETLAGIAEGMGVSRERVRQRVAAAVGRMRGQVLDKPDSQLDANRSLTRR